MRAKMKFMFQPSVEFDKSEYKKLAYKLFDIFEMMDHDDADIVAHTDLSTQYEKIHDMTIAFEVKKPLSGTEVSVLEELIDDAVTELGHMFVKNYDISYK